MATTQIISSIQFKRGTLSALTKKLVGDNKPKGGEPIAEVNDNGTITKIKIGDGTHNYADLPYLAGSGSDTDPRFLITDPIENQVILYDATTEKWVNKTLSDEESIVYLNASGLTLKGYDTAKQGQMLVKDTTKGITWVDPLSDATLQQYVAQAQQASETASGYASDAGSSASDASGFAASAEAAYTKTVEYAEKKFQWYTLAEYNALTSLDKDTFYFITTEE